MTHKDAAMFPVIASCALVGLYVFFQLFSKEYVNLLLSLYFAGLGVFALLHSITPLLNWLPIPEALPLPSQIKTLLHVNFRLTLVEENERSAEENADDSSESSPICYWINETFTGRQVIGFVPCACLGAWYLAKKHWIANNIFGLVFSVTGVEVIHINTFSIGVLLLGGLFIYDIFWVFFTDVMVTVAKTFEAPIKCKCSYFFNTVIFILFLVVFPQDLITNGIAANNFAMLGLGDIVLPGLVISLMLRADSFLRPGKTPIYFICTLIAYVFGLLVTVLVLQIFQHAQPALLYLVPACLGTPLILALIRGEMGQLFGYSDHPAEVKESSSESEGKKID